MPERIKTVIHNEWVLSMTLLNGLCVLMLGLSALLGYAFRFVSWYQWGYFAVGMAPNTAIGLFICGLTFVMLSIYLKEDAYYHYHRS